MNEIWDNIIEEVEIALTNYNMQALVQIWTGDTDPTKVDNHVEWNLFLTNSSDGSVTYCGNIQGYADNTIDVTGQDESIIITSLDPTNQSAFNEVLEALDEATI